MTAHGNSGHQLSNPHISSSQSTSSSVKLTSRPRPKTVVNPSVNTNSTSKAATKRNIDGASSINRSKNPNLRELANSTAGRPKTSTSTRIQNSMTSNPCPPNPSVAGSASPVTLMQSMAMPMFSSEFTDAMSKLMSDPIYRMAVMYGYMMGSAPQQPSTPSINLFNPMNMFPQIPLMSTNDKPSIQQKASEDDTNDEILTANSCLDEECISTNPGSLDDIMNQSEEYIDAMESYSAYTDSQKLSHSTDLYSSVLGPNKGKAKVSANSQFQSPSTGNTPKGQLSDEDEEEM
ncbi:hypothetical protein BKA69DRAFT_1059840 [Paraphysoderma sedebokerense]|nr:hypothetical protein BKA69DRAFT_1059840 [Paraphysoderma sedebokerense]